MTTNSSFHPPIVLADARERHARRQRPYPAVVADTEFRAPLQAHVRAANDQAELKRANRRARYLVLLCLACLPIALGIHFLFR
jgi:hypothetical protein